MVGIYHFENFILVRRSVRIAKTYNILYIYKYKYK
jgi:hypothetical protein